MRTVYKYRLDLGHCKVAMPAGARLVLTAVQNDKVCVWFEVDTEQRDEARRFLVVGTGHPLPTAAEYRHIGSCATTPDHMFVWHVYEFCSATASGEVTEEHADE